MTPEQLRALADAIESGIAPDLQYNLAMDAIDLRLQSDINQANAAAIRRDVQQGTTFRTAAILDFQRQMNEAERRGFNRAYGIQ